MRNPAAAAKVPRSTRVKILDEVERLIARRGVAGFTLDDVAAPLRVRVPSIYKHFASRDDVMIEVARRFISALSHQFAVTAAPGRSAPMALRANCDGFVDFHAAHPAYVRLSLTDLATPKGGMEYVKRAAGGPFRANFRSGPLAPMHRRLQRLLAAGQRTGQFRRVDALDFYRLVKSAVLVQLVFPDDQLLRARRSRSRLQRIKADVWEIACRYLEPVVVPSTARTGLRSVKRGRRHAAGCP